MVWIVLSADERRSDEDTKQTLVTFGLPVTRSFPQMFEGLKV